jgi:hypothetical protein
MSKIALVSLGRIATAENLARTVDPAVDPNMYDKAQLWDNAYVDVDHDGEAIGRVLDTHRFDDVSGLWLAARIRIDEPPGWLKKNTPVSVSGNSLFTRERNGHTVKDILVRSVALVSPACTPAQSGARVLTLREQIDPWDAPPPTLSELGPLTQENAIEHWDARMALGEDPDAAFRDIERKLARRNYDPRLGRVWNRTNVRSPAAGRGELRTRTFPTKITVR